MRRNEILSISLVAIILAFSFFALTYSCDSIVRPPIVLGIDSAQQVAFSTPLIFGLSFREDSRLLNQSTRMEIYNFVKNNPGIHFRGVCDNLGLPIGVVQYHLRLLVGIGLLSVYRDGRYKRYFESKKFDKDEMKLISLLRHETMGKILSILLKQPVYHKDLASKLKISSQALTWQITRLKKMGLIGVVEEEMKVNYFLNEENASSVKRCLSLIG